jgi:hypothetical protein
MVRLAMAAHPTAEIAGDGPLATEVTENTELCFVCVFQHLCSRANLSVRSVSSVAIKRLE